jgi:D-alanyl-D-alanine carboxypeptidase
VCASGYNIIATAKRGETRLIAVVLGSRNPRVRQRETVKLLDRGFKIAEAKLAEAKRTGTQPPMAAAPVLRRDRRNPSPFGNNRAGGGRRGKASGGQRAPASGNRKGAAHDGSTQKFFVKRECGPHSPFFCFVLAGRG